MSRVRWLIVAVPVAVAVVAAAVGAAVVVSRHGSAAGGGAARGGVALPTSMASTGDSITRAFDLDTSHFLTDAPDESWSTGAEASVNSQYHRILSAQPAIAGRADNYAQTGAVMAALDGQVKAAATQGAQYLTVLMGANDLCTPTVATMTPTGTFKGQFNQAMADFFQADPRAHVFVSSIPDLLQLWNTLHANLLAETTWTLARICQSMLAVSNTDAERRQVAAQEVADNDALASVCASFPNCRWDNDAVYRTRFPASQVSPVDFFHPSLPGQAALAATTWAAGYWPSVR